MIGFPKTSRRKALPGALLAGAVLTAVALAGCTATTSPTGGSTSSSPAPTATVTVSATPSASASAPSSASATPSATTVAATRCPNADLRGSWRAQGGAAGTEYGELVLTNTSGSTCTLHGWPGVSLVGQGHGVQIGAAAREIASTYGTPMRTVTLQPGTAAESLVGVTEAGNYGGRCEQQTADGFRVYPPGSYTSLFVAARETGCRNASITLLSVQPLVAAQ